MNLLRKFYNKMLEWKKGNGKSALLIEGARRIGKSTIAELFAQNEYEDYLLLDYRQHKSIDYLKQKYPQLKLRDKFIIYTKNLEVKDGFTYLPVYMAGLI